MLDKRLCAAAVLLHVLGTFDVYVGYQARTCTHRMSLDGRSMLLRFLICCRHSFLSATPDRISLQASSHAGYAGD